MRIIIICAHKPFRHPAMPRITRLFALSIAACLPAALPAAAADDGFKLVIQDHRFQPPELIVPAGKKLTLVVENRDPTPEEFESRALNREKVIAGKATATIFVGPLKPGRYAFVGEYNEKTAQGVIVVD